MASTDDLASDLGVAEGDVVTLQWQLGEQIPEPPNELAAFVRQMLDPSGDRTAPAGLYWPGRDDEPRRAYGLDGLDPTAP
jgi:hypothetical protein